VIRRPHSRKKNQGVMNRQLSTSISGKHHPENYGRGSRSSLLLVMMSHHGSSDRKPLQTGSSCLMQLHLRPGAMRQSAGEDAEHRARGAVDRPLVQ
jgi:hypothetical protein